jgi:hypothetical protein
MGSGVLGSWFWVRDGEGAVTEAEEEEEGSWSWRVWGGARAQVQ